MFWKPGLAEAVRELASMAKPGDVVLLSPATSSFDLFSDYKARGICFQETVREL
jgi:UDP-N-acetylmuramoylalanine--D-glutamate ligase